MIYCIILSDQVLAGMLVVRGPSPSQSFLCAAGLDSCDSRPVLNVHPIMENQMDERMENEMETGIIG